MTRTKELSRIAKLISDRLEELQGVRTQKDVADQAGYVNQNMITMIKQGHTKVALDRVMGLAKGLDYDPSHLMQLALEQFYEPHVVEELKAAFQMMLVDDERELIQLFRKAKATNGPEAAKSFMEAARRFTE